MIRWEVIAGQDMISSQHTYVVISTPTVHNQADGSSLQADHPTKVCSELVPVFNSSTHTVVWVVSPRKI